VHIDALNLREIQMRLKHPFQTSFGTTVDRRVLLVEAQADGLTGYGEITAGLGPFYNPETTETSWHIFCEYAAPLILGREVSGPSAVPAILGCIRGHEMTKAGIENALWDLEAQRQGVPLAMLLGGTMREIACGVSLGIKSEIGDLLQDVEREVAAGYQRIKIKIKPGQDVATGSAIRMRFPDIKLMVDANSAYSLSDAEHLRKFDALNLLMIEQPLDWDDIYSHVKLQSKLNTPICLDECIHNLHQTEAAVELKACRIINIKLGRVGGHTMARAIEQYCRQHSIPVWCGGMLESGIGRAHNIAMSTLAGFVLPGDVSASQRYWDEDIIDPEVEVSPAGTIRVSEKPGLGYQVRREKVERLTTRYQTYRAKESVAVV